MTKNRPTLKTVAAAAGVTANTVSLALRGSPLVAQKTKEHICASAKNLGYLQDTLAGSLRTGRSRLIALVFGDIANPLFAARTKHLEKTFGARGYQVMILNTDENSEQEISAIRTAIGRKVDGVVLCPCQKGREAPDLLSRFGIPCVMIGRQFDDGREDAVVWDDEQGGYLAASYLINRGCRDVLMLNGPTHVSSAQRRRAGFIRAHGEHGFTVSEDRILSVEPVSGRATILLDHLALSFDGVFAFNDLLAWEVSSLISPSIPVIGFDDMQSSLSLPFALSSISADLDREAALVTELLLARIEKPDALTELRVLPVRTAAR
jgi:LacI family transcriptional regulator